jgi:LPS export ABC transporter protein LptC
MRNVARGVLVVVGLFVVVLAGTLFLRSRAVRVEPVGPEPTRADLRVKEVNLEEEARGVRWRLRAEQALMYEEAGRTKLKNLIVDVIQRDRTWTLVGDEGDLDKRTNNVEVRGGVVLRSNDGLRLETSVLRWDADARRLWTDVPVVLSRNGSIVRGNGLEVQMAEEATSIGGRVRASFVVGPSR